MAISLYSFGRLNERRMRGILSYNMVAAGLELFPQQDDTKKVYNLDLAADNVQKADPGGHFDVVRMQYVDDCNLQSGAIDGMQCSSTLDIRKVAAYAANDSKRNAVPK